MISNDCLSWMSNHPHYFCFLPSEDVLRLSYLFLRCADRIIGWKATPLSSFLSGPSCLATWRFTIINCGSFRVGCLFPLFLLKSLIVKLVLCSKSIFVTVICYQLLNSNIYCYIFNLLLISVMSGEIELISGPKNNSS